MPIINHRYFKSQAFYFKTFDLINPLSSIIEMTPSDGRGPSQWLLASLIQSAEAPFPLGSSILVFPIYKGTILDTRSSPSRGRVLRELKVIGVDL
jgi:hypothetical protein